MKDKRDSKLWVLKLCLKIVYPKFNSYTFLVFMVIKFKVLHKKKLLGQISMDTFSVKAVPVNFVRLLVRDKVEENLPVVLNKCIVVSREQFIQLTRENLFYIDNGILWVALKLSPDLKRTHKNPKQESIFKYNLNFLTSKVHQQLWTDNAQSVYNVRIVPIVGSKFVQDNIAYTTENEFYNTASTFGLENIEKYDVSFHPIPSLEFAPKIAAVAEVNMILNDYDLPNDFIKEVLNNYFEMPKLVSVNDVFSIDLVPEITGKNHHKYIDLVDSTGKLYFKCNKLNGDVDIENSDVSKVKGHDYVIPTYFIVRGVTQLTLGENIHSVKPRDEYFKQSDNKLAEVLRLCPTGLRHKFNQIQDTIYPFLCGDINELSSSMSSPIIPMLLLTGLTGSGRHLLVKTLAKCNGMNCLQIDCNGLQSSTAKQTESRISSSIQKAKAAAPVIVLLDNFEVFAVDPENNEDCRVVEYFINTITDLYQNYTKHSIIFIALTEKVDLKPNILRIFLETFHIPRLNNQQRYEMLQWFASVMNLNIDEEHEKSQDNATENITDETNLSKHSMEVLQRLAAKTETFLYGDIDTLVHFALRESYLKQSRANQPSTDPDLHLVSEDDFNSALESIRSLRSQHLDAPKIPKVYWQDIGGLDKLKKELLKTIEFPIKYPHLFKNSSLKRSGILLYGPPGCGKTLVAKAVSTELNVSFLSVKGPELLNMYIGQSEENVRKVFESARASSPCIIFLDELDALAPRRGAAGDSGGASDRVVSQLLAELDGVASREDAETNSFVFIMGATNRPDLLEQSLLRPGRLDKLIYVGPYAGQAEKTSVLRALSRNYKLGPEVNLESVANSLPDRCTGADLLHVVSTARASAVRTLVAKLHAGSVKESELSPESIVLGVADLLQGVSTFRPSVTDEELVYYESLQTQI